MKKTLALLDKLGLSLQTFKTALAAALSWITAIGVSESEHPYFAPLAAILTVQVTVADSWEKATQRIIGLIGGVIVSMLISHWFAVGMVSIFLVILLGMALAKVLRMNTQVISQVAVSSFLVLAFGGTQGYILHRIVETLIGSAVAIAVNALIVPQKTIPVIQNHILKLSELSANALSSLADLLDSEARNQHVKTEVKALIEQTEATMLAFRNAQRALRYTPLLTGVKERLNHLAPHIHNLEHVTVQIRGIRRGIFDLYTEMHWVPDSTVTKSLKAAISATAACISQFGKTVVTNADADRDALSGCVENAKLIQLQCLAETQLITSLPLLRDIGSILTDLKRILKEVELT